MNAPISKSWVSSCLPILWELENLCFRFRTQVIFRVTATAVTKDFMDDLRSVNMLSLSSTESYGRFIIPWEVEKFMVDKMSQVFIQLDGFGSHFKTDQCNCAAPFKPVSLTQYF